MLHKQPEARSCATLVRSAPGPRKGAVASFCPAFRDRLQELASGSRAIEDLAKSFPGLLFAMATGYGTAAARRQAIGLVNAGAPVRDAAAALGLPLWLRRLPAHSFTEPLRDIPGGPDFSARIVNLLPDKPVLVGSWLRRVLYGHRACHAEFALWLARHQRTSSALAHDDQVRLLAAWAWHAGQPLSTGYRLLRRPWIPAFSLRRALDELLVWRRRIALAVSLGADHGGGWLKNGEARGLQFVALETIDDFIAESEAMDNCLDQFADRMREGDCRVFSVRADGRPVANVEIGSHPQDPQLPTIVQLSGPRNKRASPQYWQAAYAWLGAQSLQPRPVHAAQPTADRRRARRAFWLPYLAVLGSRDRQSFEKLVLFEGRSPARSTARIDLAPRSLRSDS
jgi:hypothetical protein